MLTRPALVGAGRNARPRGGVPLRNGFIAQSTVLRPSWWRCFSKFADMNMKNRGKILELILCRLNGITKVSFFIWRGVGIALVSPNYVMFMTNRMLWWTWDSVPLPLVES